MNLLYYVDYLLDRITMYRLVLYYLLVLLGGAVVASVIGLINYDPIAIVFTAAFITAISFVTNKVFAYVFNAPANVESVYITALILACIISPVSNIHGVPFIFWAAVLAQASKYILTLKGKHIFNPVAIAVVLTAFGLGSTASWWVGNAVLTPLIVIGGLMIIRKTRREHMVFSFFISSLLLISLFALLGSTSLTRTYNQVFLHSSLFFFAFVMLTEPLTSPTTRLRQILYGAVVGVLFPPQVHFLSFYLTPELALSAGNILTYFISPKQRLVLNLSEKLQLSPDIMDFIFRPKVRLNYLPGQYLEWTLPHPNTDSRGNRRYFTLASSPTEDTLRIGVKFYENGSSYKRNLHDVAAGGVVAAGQLAGDFTLPKDKTKKLVFVAGGIGVTPFRSMLKYLIDTKEKRNIVVIFSNKLAEDIVYKDVLDEAERELGIKTIYTVTDKEHEPSSWTGNVGRVDSAMIQSQIPDWKERTYYLSGPHVMVVGFEKTLTEMGIPSSQIKKDFFPGFV